MSIPRVSVLMPTYNQARFLPRALAGLAVQQFQDFETIICDDGSTDETPKVLATCGGRVVTHSQNRGTAAAINTAYSMAKGELITWVSSDNVMYPNWLSSLVRHLDGNPEDGAVYSAYQRIEDGVGCNVFPGDYDPGRLISSENCYFGPSFLIRREVWQEHRGGTAHDYDNWARVEEACWKSCLTIDYVPEVLCDYYKGDWNTSLRHPELYDAPKWRAEALKRRSIESSRT
jgi:glycosyltransferase involved in cell wall biosynthesis